MGQRRTVERRGFEGPAVLHPPPHHVAVAAGMKAGGRGPDRRCVVVAARAAHLVLRWGEGGEGG